MAEAGFEQYRKLNRQQENVIQTGENEFNEFLEQKKNKGLDIPQEGQQPMVRFDYDADQLLQKFEERNRGGAEDFKKRTEYFFTNSAMASARAEKYRRLAANADEKIRPFSRAYSYHWTMKRKNNASKASKKYLRMQELMNRLSEDDANLSAVEKYRRREEIMNLRIEAMCASSVTKAKSRDHEKYLQSRAMLSCYMILKDQLEHIINDVKEEQGENNPDLVKLERKMSALQNEIKNAHDTVARYAPTVMGSWKNKNNMNSDYYTEKKEQYKSAGTYVHPERVGIMADLDAFKEASKDMDYPQRMVLKDRAGQPVNKAEYGISKWNKEYIELKDKAPNDPDAAQKLKDMDMQALERFNKLHVPTENEVNYAERYVSANLRDYYELFKRGLKYYSGDDLPEHIKAYKSEHPEFQKKLEELKKIDQRIDRTLHSCQNPLKERGTVELKLMTKKEIDDLKTELQSKQSKFMGDAMKVYLANESASGYAADPVLLQKAEKAMKNYKGVSDGAAFLSREPGALLRLVHYDTDHNPISYEDYVNSEWNRQVLDAFEKGDNDAIDNMIKEELPGCFKDIKVPKPPVNAGMEWLSGWIENEFMADPEKWLFFFKKQTSLGNLTQSFKTARDIMQNDKDMAATEKVVSALSYAVNLYLVYKYRFDFNKTGKESVLEQVGGSAPLNFSTQEGRKIGLQRSKDNKEKDATYEATLKAILNEYENSFKELQNSTPNNRFIDPDSNDEKEFKRINQSDPVYTRQAHEIHKRHEKAKAATNRDPVMRAVYREFYNNNKEFKRQGGESLDRDLGFNLKYVEYDESFTPLPEYKENYEYNLKWLKAWRDNDKNAIEDMLTENIPHVLDMIKDVELPPEPTEQEIADLSDMQKINSVKDPADLAGYNSYYNRLEEYALRLLNSDNYIKYTFVLSKGLSLDSLRRNSTSFERYLKDNPKLDTIISVITAFDQFNNLVTKKHYHMENGRWKENAIISNNAILPIMSSIVQNYVKFLPYKNDTLKEYK